MCPDKVSQHGVYFCKLRIHYTHTEFTTRTGIGYMNIRGYKRCTFRNRLACGFRHFRSILRPAA